jgi:hypothetical protein
MGVAVARQWHDKHVSVAAKTYKLKKLKTRTTDVTD